MIRRLQRHDYDQICDLMIDYSRESGMKDYQISEFPRDHAYQVLVMCEKRGISFISQEGDKITGFILSMFNPDIWLPKIIRLREVAWYVAKSHRGGSTGAKLFHRYCQAADREVEQGRITGYTISKLATSADFNYESRGFKFVESTWFKGDR